MTTSIEDGPQKFLQPPVSLQLSYREGGLRPGYPARSPFRAFSERRLVEPQYIGPPDRVIAAYFSAATRASADVPPVVICTGLGYEGLFLQPALRVLAEQLCLNGCDVLRFDYDGTGDSAGDDADAARLSAWLSSIDHAVEFVRCRTGADRVTLIGIRAGALLARMAAARRGDIHALVLWNAMTGRQFVRHMRAFTMLAYKTATREPDGRGSGPELGIESNGHFFGPETLADLEALDQMVRDAERGAPPLERLLVMEGPGAGGAPPADLVHRGRTVDVVSVPGFDAMLQAPTYTEIPEEAFGALLAWLSASRPPSARHGSEGLQTRRSGLVAVDVREELVWCDPEGTVFGVWATRPDVAPERAIVFLNNAAGSHVGPHGMWTTVSRALARQGIGALRLDLTGVGESPMPSDRPSYHPYSPDRVPDVRAAIDWLVARGVRRVCLAGLCSGGFLSLRTACDLEYSCIDHLILINTQKYLWRDGDALDVSPLQDVYELQGYASSMRSAAKWKRLLRGEVNVGYFASLVGRRLAFMATSLSHRVRAMLPFQPKGAIAGDFERVLAMGIAIDYVVCSNDPALPKIVEELGHRLKSFARRYRFRLTVVEGADHSFTPRWATARLLQIVSDSLAGGEAAGPTRRARAAAPAARPVQG